MFFHFCSKYFEHQDNENMKDNWKEFVRRLLRCQEEFKIRSINNLDAAFKHLLASLPVTWSDEFVDSFVRKCGLRNLVGNPDPKYKVSANIQMRHRLRMAFVT